MIIKNLEFQALVSIVKASCLWKNVGLIAIWTHQNITLYYVQSTIIQKFWKTIMIRWNIKQGGLAIVPSILFWRCFFLFVVREWETSGTRVAGLTSPTVWSWPETYSSPAGETEKTCPTTWSCSLTDRPTRDPMRPSQRYEAQVYKKKTLSEHS